ncbi:MAG: photosynthetic protein synthase I [Burkholderiales bacterium]|nr:MAG: photosynthetic protein synthase I [Burkholderiales bacterium]
MPEPKPVARGGRRKLRASVGAALLAALCASGAATSASSPAPSPAASPAPRVAERIALGRELFFESRLSGDGSRSCASCHAPDKGYADGEALSRGYNHAGHFRNTPSLIALAAKPRLMWDGRYPAERLADVVVDMIRSPVTMNGDLQIVVERVRQLPSLLQAWQRAYGAREAPSIDGLVDALAAYASSRGNAQTPVDRALHGDEQALSAAALEGMRLFQGKAGCARCHSGAAFTDGGLHRLGVPENPEILRDPERTISLLRHYAVHGARDPMSERADTGAAAWTQRAADRGRFATPSLRGVALTAPYMHNGVFATLAQVVEFYDRGGGRASELQPLGLDARERAALVAFLEALSPPLPPESAPPTDNYATTGAGR